LLEVKHIIIIIFIIIIRSSTKYAYKNFFFGPDRMIFSLTTNIR